MNGTGRELRFLPWLRRGLSASIPESGQAGWGARPAVPVTLNVRHDATVEPVSTTLRVYGPGDVVQLDPAQVIATEPKPFAAGFEPNYLAAVVFDSPELPWLFSPDATPAIANPSGRLRPWLCLIVVRREAAQIAANPQRPVPTLTLADATGELPDLSESWAWAHAQLIGTASVDAALAGPPERTLSRLVCPRRLRPRTAYLACVVPTFAAGRQAGLGEPVTATVEPAWAWPGGGRVDLPVYYSWEFATGAEGDFESLVRKLEPRALGPEVGQRPLDIARAGPGMPQLGPGDPGSVLGLEGALRSPSMLPSDWPDTPRRDFQQKLEAQLTAPQGTAQTTVTPPLYGGTHGGVTGPASPPAPAWLRELNLDPRHRAAAAFGVRVVQQEQEQLVASAWDQVGEIERANQLRREAQLARAAAASLREKRLAHLPPRTLLRVTEPAHARIPAPPAAPASQAATLLGSVQASVFPEQATSTTFRRMLRPRGPLGRRLGADGPVSELVRRLAQGSVTVPIAEAISGGVQHDAVGAPTLGQLSAGVPAALGWRLVSEFADLAPLTLTAAAAPLTIPEVPDLPAPLVQPTTKDVAIDLEPRALAAPTEWMQMAMMMRRIDDDLPGDTGETVPVRLRRLGGINGRFRAAAGALQTYLGQPAVGAATSMVPPPQLPVEALAPELVGRGGRLDPEVTVPQAVLPLVAAQGAPPAGDVLAPAPVSPSFPQPMYEALRDLSQQLLLPGADAVPANTVGVLEGNPRFIEAFMVGLNHELAREFLWRGLPANPRATYCRQFWDIRGRDPTAPGPATDIPEIPTWPAANALGANATRVGGSDMLVLLVRGELVRRYPTVTVYAVRAAGPTTLGSVELHPEFRGLLEPDLLFLGFGLGVAQARGGADDPGWFFVLQEQVTEPRFGFDEPPVTGVVYGGAPARWRDLTWAHLVADAAGNAALTHVPVAAPLLNPRLRNLSLEGATWGLNAAHMAEVTLQLPARVALHASDLLPPGGPTELRVTAVRRSRTRITELGGADAFGVPWRIGEEQAIAALHAGRRRFYVEQPTGDRVELVVSRRRGREYLKTTADGDLPNNLLELPDLPR